MNDSTGRRPRVALVFGGRSSEHAISCVTAGSVWEAIDRDKYDVVPIGIAPDGQWVLESEDPGRHQITARGEFPAVDDSQPGVALVRTDTGTSLTVSDPGAPPREFGDVDVVFPLLHGPWGEDGTIQGMLDMAGVRYVGAGVLASAVAMDKAFMKVVLAQAGLPTMPSVTVTAREWERDRVDARERIRGLGFPSFAKPARGGSSIGIAKIHDDSEIDAALEGALEHDPKVLVEVAAEGAREVECGVLQTLDGESEASVPAEIKITGDHEFYDFDAKYLPEEATELDVPADLPAEVTASVQDLARQVFTVTGCEGLARVDFFVMADHSIVVNELNTMPGFTPLSMFPRMWAESGLPYDALIDRLIGLALQRGTGLR